MDLEIEASLVGESHNFFQDEPDSLDEKRIDKGVDDFTVLVSRMLFKNNLILNKEMRHVEVKVDVLRHCIQPD